MLSDATFWAFIALVLFIGGLIYFRLPGMIGRSLDARAQRIRNEIEEARELKEEAKQQLAEFQRRRREAEAEAKEIIAAAKREAEAIVDEARAKSESYLARRTAMAELKISQAEADAVAEVRASAVDLAVAAAGRIIAERNSGSGSDRFVSDAISEIKQKLQ
ncbi:F0F1 ATP synthase subunit B [Consotaella salsifontis]|uniref:ATP synthase subunit b n=1 Tax=Consotaella salsifontis TaxID=1365950 RepID=A0A1T4N1Z6_9HYPH|nr:F0F1 ATP synthase subunit B [Consotaella salsifontis]SJZ72888.1 F-type H+-transporting ATPase subunit b [Consotaella salsifontis]